ncbi:chemotaxis protein CheA [Litoribrevibacter albus]|uniref:Chemotaxis protein CheA n=1 Tax=Litoribrevibacter albus TaxID=1473156 RepID=A0AA37SBR5_9GAMM|nr:chemotaxis protein CheA [Litoribrevibacter albus]GLQ32334.1 chemotaxis protein CheA [Litoribrevibacter albus]
MSIDLSQFHQVFFEESFEGLDSMEEGLLDLNPDDFDVETINTIFRAAHSIKGGAGTFGFQVVAEFTHVVETLLDEIRAGSRTLEAPHIDLLLRSVDCLREIMNSLQDGEEPDMSLADELKVSFEAVLAGETPAEAEIPEEPPALSPDQPSNGYWAIYFKPDADVLRTGNEPVRMFRELESLGAFKAEAVVCDIPELGQLDPESCYLAWNLTVEGGSRAEVDEVFEWVIDESELSIRWVDGTSETSVTSTDTASDSVVQSADGVVTEDTETSAGDNTPYEIVPEAPVLGAPVLDAAVAEESIGNDDVANAASPEAGAATPEPQKAVVSAEENSSGDAKPAKKSTAKSSETTSIRVGIDKIDSLINMVGELVITQSMLGQLGSSFDMDKLVRLQEGLAQLEHNTRELQESVMRIRMLPISFCFSRFPRLVRDLSKQMNKKIDLVLLGENTELDKTVMEKIGDPMVHLIRNSLDHGIEMPEERTAAGKPETGTITLNAFHQGGNIVIQIIDDGKGLDRDRILSKAVERGLISESDRLSDDQINELIFHPGFSTADKISDISGRGVGMDVVRRNIQELNGSVEVESTPGEGSTFTIRLPLTLAILDGQLVRVGKEVFILPLVSIIESLQVDLGMINNVGGQSEVLRLRDEYVPIVKLHELLNVEPDNYELENGLLVVVEADNSKVGLFVDDLLAQQQVVIKSLEQNYQRVEGISGATILGDGKVALIVDISGVLKMASQNNGRLKNKDHQAA